MRWCATFWRARGTPSFGHTMSSWLLWSRLCCPWYLHMHAPHLGHHRLCWPAYVGTAVKTSSNKNGQQGFHCTSQSHGGLRSRCQHSGLNSVLFFGDVHCGAVLTLPMLTTCLRAQYSIQLEDVGSAWTRNFREVMDSTVMLKPSACRCMQPRAKTYDEGRLLGLSEAIRQLDRTLVQQMSDARLLKGETLAILAKSGAPHCLWSPSLQDIPLDAPRTVPTVRMQDPCGRCSCNAKPDPTPLPYP